MSTVNMLNWRKSPDFLHFLQFEFNFEHAPADVRRKVLILLPLCVEDGRLIGSVSSEILRVAIEAYNRPIAQHMFALDSRKRWRYMGSLDLNTDSSMVKRILTVLTGRLRRDLTPGSFCATPHTELMKKT